MTGTSFCHVCIFPTNLTRTINNYTI